MNRERETFPTAIEAFFLVVALFGIEFLIGALMHDVKSVSGIDPQDMAGAIAVLGNGVLFSVVLNFKGTTYSSLFHSSKASVAAVLGTLALPVLCIVPALSLALWTVQVLLVQLFPMSGSQEAIFGRMLSSSVVTVLTVCLVAPVLEEMLFRGVILRSFLHQYSRWQAILGSALLFGLAHLNLYQLATGMMMGTVLGWLYERTKSLWPSILLHGTYNATVMIIFRVNMHSKTLGGWRPSFAYWASAFVLASIGTLLFRRLLVARA